MRLGGFWEELVGTVGDVATTALNRPTYGGSSVYSTPPMFPAQTSYPPAYQQTSPGDWMQPSMNTLLLVGAVGLGIYLLMQPRRRR